MVRISAQATMYYSPYVGLGVCPGGTGGAKMLEPKMTLAAAAIIAGAVLIHGYLLQENYAISAAGADGLTVWRINIRTGKVSVCGTMLPGPALSEASASINKSDDSENFKLVTTPRCSAWSQ